MSKHQPNPFLSLQHRAAQLDLETPDYLVSVLATFDNLDEAANRERATILYCRGHRAADIALALQMPISTITSWLKDARYLLAAELRAGREEHLLRAIESARALAAEAWTAYERDCELQRDILAGKYDRPRRRVTRPDRSSPSSRYPAATVLLASPSTADDGLSTADDSTGGDLLYEEIERPRFTSQAARLLTVALAAQREVARLQGLYEHLPPPPQPVDFNIHGPLPEDPAPSGAAAPTPPESAPDNTPDDESDESPATGLATQIHQETGLAAGLQPAIPPSDNVHTAHGTLPFSPQSSNTQ